LLAGDGSGFVTAAALPPDGGGAEAFTVPDCVVGSCFMRNDRSGNRGAQKTVDRYPVQNEVTVHDHGRAETVALCATFLGPWW
jgi:hypothetical protein